MTGSIHFASRTVAYRIDILQEPEFLDLGASETTVRREEGEVVPGHEAPLSQLKLIASLS